MFVFFGKDWFILSKQVISEACEVKLSKITILVYCGFSKWIGFVFLVSILLSYLTGIRKFHLFFLGISLVYVINKVLYKYIISNHIIMTGRVLLQLNWFILAEDMFFLKNSSYSFLYFLIIF